MSHFTVAVISESIDDIKQLLAPYQENNMGDCPEQYMEFNDVEDKKRKEWETKGSKAWYADITHRIKGNIRVEETIEEIRKDGYLDFTYDDAFNLSKVCVGTKVSVSGHVDDKSGAENYREIYLEVKTYRWLTTEEIIAEMGLANLLSIRRNFSETEFLERIKKFKAISIHATVIDPPEMVPYKEQFPSFDKYMLEYEGIRKDETTGRYGYWENPNAKWDWYSLGGRWMGSLLIDGNTVGKKGKPGTFDNEEPNCPSGYQWVDSCRVSDVKWEKMREISEFELLKNEDTEGDLWELLISKDPAKERLRSNHTWYNQEYFIERYKNKENYVKQCTTFSTYAVITPDGVWHAPGEMGWFGFSSEKFDDKNTFVDEFYENFIKPNQDKVISIIDCHI